MYVSGLLDGHQYGALCTGKERGTYIDTLVGGHLHYGTTGETTIWRAFCWGIPARGHFDVNSDLCLKKK